MTMYRRMALRAEAEESEGRLRFVLATEGRKADGIDLRMANVDLERFESNPVILALHDYWSLPVGRAENIAVEGKRLMADAVFDLDDATGAALDRKYRGGFMNAVSIGFDAYDVDGNGIPTRWEPLEFSAVPIPMDAKALIDSGRKARAFMAMTGAASVDELIDAVAGRALDEAERAHLAEVAGRTAAPARDKLRDYLLSI